MNVFGSADTTKALDQHITDLGGLIALALALVTVFTTVRATRAIERGGKTGLTHEALLGELGLDFGLFALTVGVILAACPLFVGAVQHLAIGHQSGALRITFAVVWVLLVGLAGWQLLILRSTLGTTKKVW